MINEYTAHSANTFLEPPPKKTFSILIADTDTTCISMLSDIGLADMSPLRILVASTENEALSILKQERPDMVVLNWNTPEINGRNICTMIRKYEAEEKLFFAYTYIIAMTNVTSQLVLTDIVSSGADNFLCCSPPLQATEFIARLRAGKRLLDYNRQLLRQNTQMMRASRVDVLTGLFNRLYGEEQLTAIFSQAVRKNRSLSVCFCDLNNFKHINDTYGHTCGDEVLKRTASFLKDNLRISDVVCRWGGDEFLLIFPETSGAEAHVILSRLQKKFKDTFFMLAPPFQTLPQPGMSIGCAWNLPGRNASPQEMIQYADMLLYRLKAQVVIETEHEMRYIIEKMSQDLPSSSP
jgi:two-component system cell cycle response regulator